METFIPRFLSVCGYENIDIKENHTDRIIENHIKPKADRPFECHVCREKISRCRGSYKQKFRKYNFRLRLLHMPLEKKGRLQKVRKSTS